MCGLKGTHICTCFHWLVVGIESCMYAIVFSLESWIIYFDVSLHVPRICNGRIKNSWRCRRYIVSDSFYVNLIYSQNEWACTEPRDCNSYHMTYWSIVPKILGPHNKMSCILTRAWNKVAHSTGQPFHDIHGSIICATSLICVTSSQRTLLENWWP